MAAHPNKDDIKELNDFLDEKLSEFPPDEPPPMPGGDAPESEPQPMFVQDPQAKQAHEAEQARIEQFQQQQSAGATGGQNLEELQLTEIETLRLILETLIRLDSRLEQVFPS